MKNFSIALQAKNRVLRALFTCSFIFTILSISVEVKAQIIFDKNDLIKKDTIYNRYEVDEYSSVILNNIDLGTSGADARYDFSAVGDFKIDSSVFALKAPGVFGSSFKKTHVRATMAYNDETDVEYFRDPTNLNSTDFILGQATYKYKKVDTHDVQYGSLSRFIGFQGIGNSNRYHFGNVDFFQQGSHNEEYLTPSKTSWASDFPGTNAAKRSEVVKNDKGQTFYEIYDFYQAKGNDYLKTGVGIKVDKGLLTNGTPNGTYIYSSAKVLPAQLVYSANFNSDTSLVDSSIWRISVKEDATIFNHWDATKDSFFVDGSGLLILPRDTFEVLRVWKKTTRISADSISISGTLHGVDIDTQHVNTIEFYSKGFGAPIVRMVVDVDTQLISLDYLDTINPLPLGPLKPDTIFKSFILLQKTDKAVSTVGQSYVLDVRANFGAPPTGIKDTVHGVYKGNQLKTSAALAYGFYNKDSVSWELNLDARQGIEMKVEISQLQTSEVDGYGTLHLGNDTAQVIRVKVKHTETWKRSQFVNGVLKHVEMDTSHSYFLNYLGKKAGLPLVELEFADDSYNRVRTMKYTDVPKRKYNSLPVPVNRIPTVFPNPANESFTFATPHNESQRIEVLDLTGKVILNETVQGNSTFDVSQWDAGVYLVKLTDTHTVTLSTTKLIVE